MASDQKGFIEKLRSLDEPAKRKVMFGAVAVSMVLVVYLWLVYFNTIVPSATLVTSPTSTEASAPNGSETNIFGLVADAANSFWKSVVGGVEGIAGALKNSKQYNISPR